ncbi:hypothetical protein ACFYZJ_27770 [Streptomyces sp. NPDC001848]|uniref:hypothetical protein n=1 Tax=Streptomyces sp. NPDC001848 TaxID=3364618 RepID=UPI00368B80A6
MFLPRFVRSTYRSAALARATADAGAICAALPTVLGPGYHRFDLVVEWSDGTLDRAEGAMDEGSAGRPGAAGPEPVGELADVRALLASALSGRGISAAVLVARTAAVGTRVCGWSVRDGWVEALDPRALSLAVTPCPGVPVVPSMVSRAPALVRDRRRRRRHVPLTSSKAFSASRRAAREVMPSLGNTR